MKAPTALNDVRTTTSPRECRNLLADPLHPLSRPVASAGVIFVGSNCALASASALAPATRQRQQEP